MNRTVAANFRQPLLWMTQARTPSNVKGGTVPFSPEVTCDPNAFSRRQNWPTRSLGQAGLNHLQKFGIVCRLLEESRRPRLQSAPFTALRVAGCQDDDRDGRELVILLEPVEHDKAVTGRQAEIKNDKVRVLFVGQRNRGVAVARVDSIVVVGSQPQSQRLPEIGII